MNNWKTRLTIPIIGFNHKTSTWIDQFQQQLSIPVASAIAKRVSTETEKVVLIGMETLVTVNPDNRLLLVVLGPFAVLHEERYSYWLPFKVLVHNKNIATAICRLNNSGKGGFYTLKLWDLYEQKYKYFGDPDQERQIKAEWVVQLVSEHLASQYHVGFVEKNEHGLLSQHLRSGVGFKNTHETKQKRE